jgi:hypothetical protein
MMTLTGVSHGSERQGIGWGSKCTGCGGTEGTPLCTGEGCVLPSEFLHAQGTSQGNDPVLSSTGIS